MSITLVTPYLYCGKPGEESVYGCGELLEVLHTARFTDPQEAEIAISGLLVQVEELNRHASYDSGGTAGRIFVEFDTVEMDD